MPRQMPRPTAKPEIRHIQIELPVEPYEEGKRIARANGLSLSAYVRQAILQRIRQDSENDNGK